MAVVKWVRVWRGPCRGLVVPVDGQGAWRVRLGGYEAELHRAFKGLVRRGDWMLDVGCGWGYYALAGARAGAVVTGVDRDGERLAVAREALDLNGLSGMLAEMELGVLPRGVDAVKMDVEGAEATILERSKDVLVESGPRLLVEVHGHSTLVRCCRVLEECGYWVEKIAMSRSVFREDVHGERCWLFGVPDEA